MLASEASMVLSLNDRVDHILKLELVPELKKLGWKKRQRTFMRDAQTRGGTSTKALQILEIGVGGSKTSVEGVVYVTCAVFFPEFVPILTPWQTKPPAQLKAMDGQLKAPLGAIGPWKNPDLGFRLEVATNEEAFAKE